MLTGDETELGEARSGLARVAAALRQKAVEGEYNRMFICLGRGELLPPYASCYMTGFLNEKPLATLRDDMARAGIARSPNVFEPEDNSASLMHMMAGMILGRSDRPSRCSASARFSGGTSGPGPRISSASSKRQSTRCFKRRSGP